MNSVRRGSTRTELVIVGQAEAVDAAFFRHAEGEVGAAEHVAEQDLPFDLDRLGGEQAGCGDTRSHHASS